MTGEAADVLVKGGLVVSGDGISRADIRVKDGRVSEVGPDLSGGEAGRVIDAAGKYVLRRD